MDAFASRTGTARNLDALRSAGWKLLVSAAGVWRTEGFPYAIDNGAWSAFQAGTPFDESAFLGLVEALGIGAEFVVVPDIVRGGLESLRFSLRWLTRLWWYTGLKLIAVQDGATPAHLADVVCGEVGIFIGGTDGWKETSARGWGDLARTKGCRLHMGRVNTARRMSIAAAAGVHSFDGTSATRYAETLPLLERTRRTLGDQQELFVPV